MHRSSVAVFFAICALGCRRTSPTHHDEIDRESPDAGAEAALDAPRPAALPPLGEVARLVGLPWTTCALTTTGRAWCFSDPDLPSHEILGWDDVIDVVAGARTVLAKNDDRLCDANWMCGLMKGGAVRCASNLRSETVRALGGPPRGGVPYSELPASQYSACGGALDDLRVDDARWIGELDTSKLWHLPVCGDSAGPVNDGLVIGTPKAVRFHITYAATDRCCDAAFGTCSASALASCSSTLLPSPQVIGWSSGIGHMEDGGWRDPPFAAGDEIVELRGTTAFAHGPAGGPFICAVETSGTVRCANDPSYPLSCAPSLPKNARHAWHRVPGIEHATAIAASPTSAVCVLQNGVPYCWGRDGTNVTDHAGDGVLGAHPGDDACPLEDGTTLGCQKTPRRVDGIVGGVQIVAAGTWSDRKAYHGGGFCVLDGRKQIVCWGPNTQGLPRVIKPPHRDEH